MESFLFILDKLNFSPGISLRINPIQRPREGNRLADVVEAADPGCDSLDAHAEAAVLDGAVLAQVEVPLEGFDRQAVRFDPGLQ